MNHKFFLDPLHVCWWCNGNNIEVISITFVPKGGWCVFYRDKIRKIEKGEEK